MDVETVRLNIPLEDGKVYVYLIEINDSYCMIDGGFCSEKHAEEIERRVDLKSVKVLLTHHHIDHVGIVFHRKVSAFMHPEEMEFLEIYTKTEEYVKAYIEICRKYGVAEHYVSPVAVVGLMNLRKVASVKPVTSFESFEISPLHCPGHTKGHLCYYYDKVLFSGDAVLSDTTPNVSPYVTPKGIEGDAVEDCINTLRKLRKLEIDVIYPAHGRVIRNPERKIQELLEHYTNRAEEIYEIAKNEWKTLEEIAREVEWSAGKYEKLGTFHRFLAVGETLSFLRYLERKGRVREKVGDGGIAVFKSL